MLKKSSAQLILATAYSPYRTKGHPTDGACDHQEDDSQSGMCASENLATRLMKHNATDGSSNGEGRTHERVW